MDNTNETVEIIMPDTPISTDNSQQAQAQNEEISTPSVVEAPTQNLESKDSGQNQQSEPKETKPKSNAGRPCVFCTNGGPYMEMIKDYLKKCREKPSIPYLQEIADMLDVDKDTISDWANKKLEDKITLEHPEFYRLIKRVENLQELRLNQRLMGRHNPTGAIFLLKTKHKYIETEKQILAGDKNEPLEVVIVEDNKRVDE